MAEWEASRDEQINEARSLLPLHDVNLRKKSSTRLTFFRILLWNRTKYNKLVGKFNFKGISKENSQDIFFVIDKLFFVSSQSRFISKNPTRKVSVKWSLSCQGLKHTCFLHRIRFHSMPFGISGTFFIAAALNFRRNIFMGFTLSKWK